MNDDATCLDHRPPVRRGNGVWNHLTGRLERVERSGRMVWVLNRRGERARLDPFETLYLEPLRGPLGLLASHGWDNSAVTAALQALPSARRQRVLALGAREGPCRRSCPAPVTPEEIEAEASAWASMKVCPQRPVNVADDFAPISPALQWLLEGIVAPRQPAPDLVELAEAVTRQALRRVLQAELGGQGVPDGLGRLRLALMVPHRREVLRRLERRGADGPGPGLARRGARSS